MTYLTYSRGDVRAFRRLRALRKRLAKQEEREAGTGGSGALSAALGEVLETVDKRIAMFGPEFKGVR